MGRTNQVFTGDNAGLRKAYDELAKDCARLEQNQQKLATASVRGSERATTSQKQWSQAITGTVTQLGSMALGWASIDTVISGVNARLREHIELANSAAEKQVTLAAAQARLALNSGGAASFQGLNSAAGRIATSARFPDQAAIVDAMTEAYSASQGDVKRAEQSVQIAAELTRENPSLLPTLAGAYSSIGRAAGVTSEEAAAFTQSVGAASLITDPKLQAKNTNRALMMAALASGEGASQKQAILEGGKYYASATAATGDKEGDRTATSWASLAVQLDDFFERGTQVGSGRRKQTIKPKFDPGTAGSRMEALMNDDKMKEVFFEQVAHFESGWKDVWKNYATKGTKEAQSIGALDSQIGFDTRPLNELRQTLRNGTPQLALSSSRLDSQTADDQLQTSQHRQARMAQAIESADSGLAQTRKYAKLPDFGGNFSTPLDPLGLSARAAKAMGNITWGGSGRTHRQPFGRSGFGKHGHSSGGCRRCPAKQPATANPG